MIHEPWKSADGGEGSERTVILPPDDGVEEYGDTSACNWSSCLTTHSTPQALIMHWEMTHLLPLIALSQLQPKVRYNPCVSGPTTMKPSSVRPT